MLNVYRMEFTWYLLASWGVISAYIAWRPKLRNDASLFVFLIMSMAETIQFTMLALELKWIDYLKTPEAFINILLLRNVLRPVLYLFAASAFVQWTGWRRWSVLLGTLLSRHVVTWLSVRAGLIELVKINDWHVALLDVAHVALACFAAVGFLRYTRPKEAAG
ncbi:hypothetical protein MO973_26590 [Paenibacillus sp. TRM 82003]|nr:hypothetical protein [Paenibacillus sp. TRM 82003]